MNIRMPAVISNNYNENFNSVNQQDNLCVWKNSNSIGIDSFLKHKTMLKVRDELITIEEDRLIDKAECSA